ncbi:NirD/YgiW/YdeI family stress tolerance protein [Sutterella sp.]|uniref:NirD/YgiW/YdeI family stress tolerance protein n=1 Tax=Sutterella sp. TaxID=1981025 RepID=UPI0026E0FB01|nr:NirD/YgiW/YdeI family stress tolerance protein [Sutterella sp.]MDO5530861.1 NirD/YgiW/YdeI family stress tolerance protein [Sutterella sp.]
MNRNSIRLAALASIAALALAAMPAAQAAGPQGFNGPQAAPHAPAASGPQGFGHDGPVTVAWVKDKGTDDQVVTLRGRFTEHLRGEKYTFVDEQGGSITAELDNDRDWSMIQRGAPVEIRAEIDRDFTGTTLDVRSARPLQGREPQPRK